MNMLAAGVLGQQVSGGGPPSTPTLDLATEWWTPTDVSGSSIPGRRSASALTLVGSPTATNDGTYRIVQLVKGSSQYLQAASESPFRVTGDFSIVHVHKPRTLSGTTIMLAKRLGSNDGYNLFAAADVPTSTIDQGIPTTITNGTISTSTIVDLSFGRVGAVQWLYRISTSRQTVACSSASITNSDEFRINRGSGATTLYADQDWYGTAVFIGTNLSDAQCSTAVSELLAVGAL
ncbi:MAG: hypothetical protein ABIO83_02420 [Ilumatobacteraceae bacterium]